MNQHIRNLDPQPDDDAFFEKVADIVARSRGKGGVVMQSGGWHQIKLSRARQRELAARISKRPDQR